MIFIYSKWTQFCKRLNGRGIQSIPAADVLEQKQTGPYLVLKHDVETAVDRAFTMAKIEQQWGHRGSYYVQAYLLHDEKNVHLLREMQEMGHEISYHYDVLDSSHGQMDRAMTEFEANLERFRENGFPCVTVCQHGNPVVERTGYHSNRDFFRSEKVQELYPDMADIMVDFKAKAGTDYLYFSDAGRKFHLIYDPINNDIVSSDHKNIGFADLDGVLESIPASQNGIVSVHPHRWTRWAAVYQAKTLVFRVIRFAAKKLAKISLFKRLMGRYYHLAKKI